MLWIMVDGLLGGLHGGAVHEQFARAQVSADAGMCAAGDLQTQPVAWLELVGRGSHIYLDQQAAVWLRLAPPRLHAEQAITHIEGTAVWLHIA